MKYEIEKVELNPFDDYQTICKLVNAVNYLIGTVTDLESRITSVKTSWPRIGDTIYRFNSQGHIKKEIWQDSAKQRRCKGFLGVYKTKLEAEQKLAEIVVSGL